MKWILGKVNLPLWTIFLLLFVQLSTLCLWLSDGSRHSNNDSTIVVISLFCIPIFYFFRFLNNRAYGVNSLKNDLIYLKLFYEKTQKKSEENLKKIVSLYAALVLIILIVLIYNHSTELFQEISRNIFGITIIIMIASLILSFTLQKIVRKRLEVFLPLKNTFLVQVKSISLSFITGFIIFIIFLSTFQDINNKEFRDTAEAISHLAGWIVWYFISPKFYYQSYLKNKVPYLAVADLKKINRTIMAHTFLYLIIFGLVIALLIRFFG